MKVAIIGCGNSGCAHAAKLVQRGHIVNIIKTSEYNSENYNYIERNKVIHCIDDVYEPSFDAKINIVTKDIEEGIYGADVIMILTQSLQHESLASRISPYFKKGQIVFVIPGNMGTYVFKKQSIEEGIVFVAGESTPYDARLVANGTVQILFKNVRNAVAFHDQEHREHIKKIDELFGTHKFYRTNVIESALHNPNLIVHTIGTIMSASRIEMQKGEFWLYKEGFSDSIWNLVAALDNEKNKVIEAYGGYSSSYLDACKWRNEEDLSIDSYLVFKSYADTGGPKGPQSLESRFIEEDIPMGLCLLENLAEKKNIQTPTASSLITIACILRNKNFRKIAYNLKDLLP